MESWKILFCILLTAFIVVLIMSIFFAIKLRTSERYTSGDQWSHKGVLHITHDEDGTYMSLELDNAFSLSEIEQNSQVIFDVKVHDVRSR